MVKKLWNMIASKRFENILANNFKLLLIFRGFQTVETLKTFECAYSLFFYGSVIKSDEKSNFKEKRIVSWRKTQGLLQ